jgi:hypothetical protein
LHGFRLALHITFRIQLTALLIHAEEELEDETSSSAPDPPPVRPVNRRGKFDDEEAEDADVSFELYFLPGLLSFVCPEAI